MQTWEDIKSIIDSPERENISLELKSVRKLFGSNKKDHSEARKEFVCDIVAMGNRYGGKFILGLNDDGTFDGKFPFELTPDNIKFDADKLKELILNICHDNISPKIDITTQILSCPEHDLLIIYVPKRKNIPYAYIPKKESTEIKSRTYYIRTSHGKNLVSDSQLEWLFKHNEDPDIEHSLRIGVEFDNNFNVIGTISPLGHYCISSFLLYLNPEEKKSIPKNTSVLGPFFAQLLPFLILRSVFETFSVTWNTKVHKVFDRTYYPFSTKNLPESKVMKTSEIPIIGTNSLRRFSWDFDQMIRTIIPNNFYIPVDTAMEINYEKKSHSASIELNNPKFKISIIFMMSAWGQGLHHLNPFHKVITERHPEMNEQNTGKSYSHIDCVCHYKAQFDFPESDMEGFENYFNYAKTIKELLDDNWNFELFRQKLPPVHIYMMEDKLDEILTLLKK